MNFNKIQVTRIDTGEVKAAAKLRMHENGNYKRTALLIGLMMLLVNVPVLAMNYVTVGFIDLGELTAAALSTLNTRLMLFQLLMVLFVAPAFTLSKTRFMLKTMRDKAGNPTELFDGLGRGSYFVSVRATLWMAAMMYIWLMIPVSLLLNAVINYMFFGGGVGAIAFICICGALTGFAMINRQLAYSMQFFMLAEHPGIGAIMSLRLSVMALRGRLMELFKLELKLLLYTLPPLLPSIASMIFLKDSVLFGIAMAFANIALCTLCYPVAEAARAEYFIRMKSIAEQEAAKARKAHDAAWSDDEAPKQPEALPGDSTGDAGDSGEIQH